MPTAAEYRDAAARLRTVGENLLRRSAMVGGWALEGHLGAGAVHERARLGLTVTARYLTSAADELARLAAVCEARAATCDHYHAQLAGYLALDPAQRALMQRPLPPFAWVR
jgi:hypothetical protein